MTHPIAMIPYANMAPFQEMGPFSDCHFVDCAPRDSIQALKDKKVWAAAVPVGGLAALEGRVSPLGLYGIAVSSEVMSVLFFSDRAFDRFLRPLTVRLTGESASSVRLLFLLLGYRHGFDALPQPVDAPGAVNGELVIGDQALQWGHEFKSKGSVHGYTVVTDLASCWHALHRLPFVFARWVAHVEAPQEVRLRLNDWLLEFSDREPELITQAMPRVAARLKLPLDVTRRYLRLIRRCLTQEDQAGQDLFLSELAKHRSVIEPAVIRRDQSSPS